MNTEDLTSKVVWGNFYKICEIPHPSRHEEKIQAWILAWAAEHNLNAIQDDAGNILIRKAATNGMENRASIALQAHMDMVPQKNPEIKHDFLKDSIKPRINGKWLTATGTTLGADNGIGLASILSILESKTLQHPELEVLLTTTEEDGMLGAAGLDNNALHSSYLLNLDTEVLGDIYIGCAGGINADIKLPLTYQNITPTKGYSITIEGLRGGHSGVDIDKNRENAIFLAAAALSVLNDFISYRLVSFHGGSVRNAIPRIAEFKIITSANIAPVIEKLTKTLQLRFPDEKSLQINCQDITNISSIFSAESFHEFYKLIHTLPNGVISLSDTVKGVVETSLSTGVVKNSPSSLDFSILIRSLSEQEKTQLMHKLTIICSKVGAQVNFGDDFPGWEPEQANTLLDLVTNIYGKFLSSPPRIQVIHAGLECGFIKAKYPAMDIVSIGPTIINAHSPDEAVDIDSVDIYWKVLTNILENSPLQVSQEKN